MLAPETLSVELAPLQIAAGEAVVVSVGIGFTVMVAEAIPVHPPELVTVTVYPVVAVGVTVITEVVGPVFHA